MPGTDFQSTGPEGAAGSPGKGYEMVGQQPHPVTGRIERVRVADQRYNPRHTDPGMPLQAAGNNNLPG